MTIKELTDPDNYHFEGTRLQDPRSPDRGSETREDVLDLCGHIQSQFERHRGNRSHRRPDDSKLPVFDDSATWLGSIVGAFNDHIQDPKLHTSIDRENWVDGTLRTSGYGHQVEVLKKLWNAFKAHSQSNPR